MSTKLGAMIDRLYAKDKEIDAQEAVLRDLKRDRAAMELELLRKFDKDKIGGAKGRRGVADVKPSNYPSIKDPRKFWKYVIARKAFDLVQKRVASRAYFDRLEAGDQVPGVEVFTKYRINVKKRR